MSPGSAAGKALSPLPVMAGRSQLCVVLCYRLYGCHQPFVIGPLAVVLHVSANSVAH